MTDIPIPDLTQQLVDELIRQTVTGQLAWEEGSAETELILTEEAGTVIVSSIDGDGTVPFELRILDSSGTVVERYTTGNGGSGGFRALYESALRSTVKPSEVAKRLYANLTAPPMQEDDIPF